MKRALFIPLAMLIGAGAASTEAAQAASPHSVNGGVAAPERLAPRSGVSLAQAPTGLRKTVHRTLGAAAASGGWSRQAELADPNASSPGEDDFGYSVAISGNTALVGADGKNSYRGAAYVFVRSPTGWSQQAKLTAPNRTPFDNFAGSVAISGNTALVGADGKNSYRGAAYVFVRSGTTWSQQAKLTAPNGSPVDYFGIAVSIFGKTALVAALGKNSDRGAAYVFVRSGTAWREQAELSDPNPKGHDNFGRSVAISGNTALVGAPGNFYSNRGAAYVFERSGTAWPEQAKLTDPHGFPGDGFANTLAISGNTALVGWDEANQGRGAVYVFERSGTAWAVQAKLTEPHAVQWDYFGAAVAISGNTAVVGAHGTHNFRGAAYVFKRSGKAWSLQAALTDPPPTVSGDDGDYFGATVAISGKTAVIGAWDKYGADGAAYVFGR